MLLQLRDCPRNDYDYDSCYSLYSVCYKKKGKCVWKETRALKKCKRKVDKGKPVKYFPYHYFFNWISSQSELLKLASTLPSDSNVIRCLCHLNKYTMKWVRIFFSVATLDIFYTKYWPAFWNGSFRVCVIVVIWRYIC